MYAPCTPWGWFSPLWFILIPLVWLLLVRLWWGRRPGTWHRSPLEHLKIRYAKGEISRDDYERLKTELTS